MSLTPTANNVACPACVAGTRALRRHLAPHNGVLYTLHHCGNCSLEFWSPLEVDASIYQDDGFSAYADYHAGRRPFPRWAKPLLEVLGDPPKRALDIGCGDGAVMSRLQALGTTVRGIDLDAQSVQVAESRCGAGTCTVSTLDEFIRSRSADAPGFDLVTFFEVLEHQVDPRGFLAQVAQLAAPGAVVAGSVPDRDRFLAASDRRLDSGDLPPHHFLWLSSNALHSLLEQAGFKAITVRKTGSIGLSETFRKMRALLARRLAAIGAPAALAGAVAFGASPLPAMVVWIGRRIRPSHLFFHCRA